MCTVHFWDAHFILPGANTKYRGAIQAQYVFSLLSVKLCIFKSYMYLWLCHDVIMVFRVLLSSFLSLATASRLSSTSTPLLHIMYSHGNKFAWCYCIYGTTKVLSSEVLGWCSDIVGNVLQGRNRTTINNQFNCLQVSTAIPRFLSGQTQNSDQNL